MALSQGYRVRGVVRKEEQISKIKSHPLMDGLTSGVEFAVIPDLGKAGAFDTALDGISVIIHLASPLAIEVRQTFAILTIRWYYLFTNLDRQTTTVEISSSHLWIWNHRYLSRPSAHPVYVE